MWTALETGCQIGRIAKSEQTSVQISIANYSHLFLKEISFMKNFILELKITYYIRVKVIFYLLLLCFCLKAYSISFYFTKKASEERFALANKLSLANIPKYINICLGITKEELLKHSKEFFLKKANS